MISSLKTRAIQGAFWAAAFTLSTQLLNLIATLILAKLLTPSDFGLIAIAQLVVATTQIFRDLGLAQALIYRSDDAEEAANTAFILVTTWGLFLYLLISIMAPQIALFFSEPQAKSIIQVMALTLVISSLGTVPSALLEKKLEFRKKVLPEILPMIAYILIAIGLATAGLGAWSIVWGRIGQAILTVILMWTVSNLRLRISFDRQVARALLDYGKHILGISILNTAFLYVDNTCVGRLLGKDALGFYTFAFALANLATQSITPIVNKVAFPSYVNLRENQAGLSKAYLRSLKLVSMVTFPITLGLAAISSDLLRVLYADKWAHSIVLVQILSLYALFRSIGGLPGNVFLTIGKHSIIPKLMLVYVGAVTILLWPVTRWLGTVGTSLVMTGVMIIGSTVWLVLANYYLAIPFKSLIKNLAPQSIASLIMVGWLLILSRLSGESLLNLILLISSGASVYAGSILLITKGGAYKEMVDIAKTLLNVPGPTRSGV